MWLVNINNIKSKKICIIMEDWFSYLLLIWLIYNDFNISLDIEIIFSIKEEKIFFSKLLSKKRNYSKILIVSLNILIVILALSNIKNIEKLKVCLCTVGKEENLYVREYIFHYKKYNLDKIFIYDNNEINGENFNKVINDYILNGFVEIINIRGKIAEQINAFQNCYEKNKNKYDWILFYDMDEYIYLKNQKLNIIWERKNLKNVKSFN